MHVSVVIPVKEDPRVVRCVESVLALRHEADTLQVVVVDNGSSAANRALLDTLPVDVVEELAGTVYAARNRGVAAARGDTVFFTDADCTVRPGWIREALAMLAGGADIVQGYSLGRGHGLAARVIQRRYRAHLRDLAPGAATECDTRNLAARRAVLEAVPFNEAYRRVGDTEFGLLAEREGFRVAYCPAMRVVHAHDTSFALFLAKQAGHGWGAQRLIETEPGIAWHSAHLRLVARARPLRDHMPARSWSAKACFALALGGGRALDRGAAHVPVAAAALALALLEKPALLAGHLAYEDGAAEPSPSELLGRALPRD